MMLVKLASKSRAIYTLTPKSIFDTLGELIQIPSGLMHVLRWRHGSRKREGGALLLSLCAQENTRWSQKRNVRINLTSAFRLRGQLLSFSTATLTIDVFTLYTFDIRIHPKAIGSSDQVLNTICCLIFEIEWSKTTPCFSRGRRLVRPHLGRERHQPRRARLLLHSLLQHPCQERQADYAGPQPSDSSCQIVRLILDNLETDWRQTTSHLQFNQPNSRQVFLRSKPGFGLSELSPSIPNTYFCLSRVSNAQSTEW